MNWQKVDKEYEQAEFLHSESGKRIGWIRRYRGVVQVQTGQMRPGDIQNVAPGQILQMPKTITQSFPVATEVFIPDPDYWIESYFNYFHRVEAHSIKEFIQELSLYKKEDKNESQIS